MYSGKRSLIAYGIIKNTTGVCMKILCAFDTRENGQELVDVRAYNIHIH